MNRFQFFFVLAGVLPLLSCSDSDEPKPSAAVRLSSITSDDYSGDNQYFVYDESGRITQWRDEYSDGEFTADYSYPSESEIKVVSVYSSEYTTRTFSETIRLENGRAVRSDGTWEVVTSDGWGDINKTYRLEYGYDDSSHLVSIFHSEVYGIGDNISESAWDKPWEWTDYLTWEDGNLKSFQEAQGAQYTKYITEYSYSQEKAEQAVIYPLVIFNYHIPLQMQGVFGQNPVNLIESSVRADRNGNEAISQSYDYTIKENRITEYWCTKSYGTPAPIQYFVGYKNRNPED